jgi:uncharacterized protein YdbL (DUF1318 family)
MAAWIVLLAFEPRAEELNLQYSTPPIALLRHNMQQRQKHLLPFYRSGAIGIARDGRLELRDASVVPERFLRAMTYNVTKENNDRAEQLAHANGQPARTAEVTALLARDWRERAQAGWWIQTDQGEWMRK